MDIDDNKIEELVTRLGEDAYVAFCDATEDIVEKVKSLIPNDNLLLATEGGLIGTCDGTFTKKDFLENIHAELELLNEGSDKKSQVLLLLKQFIESYGFTKSMAKPETDPIPLVEEEKSAGQLITKKNEGLPIVPTVRDYSLEHIGSENQSASDSSHIDPYRELPEK